MEALPSLATELDRLPKIVASTASSRAAGASVKEEAAAPKSHCQPQASIEAIERSKLNRSDVKLKSSYSATVN